MSKFGEVVQEGGVTVCEHTYIYSTLNDPAPLQKSVKCSVLSITPTFVYLLEKGQHAS